MDLALLAVLQRLGLQRWSMLSLEKTMLRCMHLGIIFYIGEARAPEGAPQADQVHQAMLCSGFSWPVAWHHNAVVSMQPVTLCAMSPIMKL